MGKFTPIAMKCNQEQFEAIKPKLGGLKIKSIASFKACEYLLNNYMGEKLLISNNNASGKLDFPERIVHETWNEKIFLEACGIETTPTLEEVKEYFKDAETVQCLHDNDAYYLDFSKEIEYKYNKIILYKQKDEPYSGCRTYVELWNNKKSYAKILAYKKPKEETFEITEKQIKEIHRCTSVINQIDIEKWFPKAFKEDKVELEVGKWYKMYFDDDVDKKIQQIIKYKETKGVEVHFEYRIDIYGKENRWVEEDWSHINHHYIEITNKEVEEALEKEAVRRGYKRDVIILDLYNGKTEISTTRVTNNIFEWEEVPCGKYKNKMALRDSFGNILFMDGIWTKIIQTIIIKEAEAKLNNEFKIVVK